MLEQDGPEVCRGCAQRVWHPEQHLCIFCRAHIVQPAEELDQNDRAWLQLNQHAAGCPERQGLEEALSARGFGVV